MANDRSRNEQSELHDAGKMNRPTPLIPRARIVALPSAADALLSIPTPMAPFIGRDDELASLSTLLDDATTRLITLTGAGGIGKTRLALAIASSMDDRFVDGALFVDLSNITSPADVIPAIAQALGLRERAGEDRRSQLYAFLRGKHLLLVLDNFEQIIDAAPEVTGIISQAPRVTILITSRAPLRVRGEHEVPVPPLALASASADPDELLASGAGRLFVARAMEHDPAFVVDDRSAPLIAEICARLDGVPLAIELAAARSKILPPRQLRDRLERR
jgi:predicted ATPase